MARHRDNSDCCGPLRLAQTLPVALQELIGLITFNSSEGQDRWILLKIFPDVKSGYFVDVGSADGTRGSNTKALEDRGWNGICIDPFPKHMEGRRCTSYKKVVYSKPGQIVSFRSAGTAGGIEVHLGRWKGWKGVQEAETVKFETTTLNKILAEAGAPEFIHYISLDIEGGELEALKGFPFDNYQIGALVVEHNYEESKHSDIKALLKSHGYWLVHTWEVDDYYLPANYFQGFSLDRS